MSVTRLPSELKVGVLLYLPYATVKLLVDQLLPRTPGFSSNEAFWWDYIKYHYGVKLPNIFIPSQEMKNIETILADLFKKEIHPSQSFLPMLYQLITSRQLDYQKLIGSALLNSISYNFVSAADLIYAIPFIDLESRRRDFVELLQLKIPSFDIDTSRTNISYQELRADSTRNFAPTAPQRHLIAQLALMFETRTGYLVDVNGTVKYLNYDVNNISGMQVLSMIEHWSRSDGGLIAHIVITRYLDMEPIQISLLLNE